MSAIFTNNYLFSENYAEMDLRSTNRLLQEWIGTMDLKDVIKFKDQENKLDNKYSKGQQKRLAFIYALLENKSFIVLDEWAAEQDPAFRRYFYQEVLPILIKQGKTIVAITHDDEYYAYASRIIKFNFGKIISDNKLTPHLAVNSTI
jgi:putative ATP-binding cassette transporter